MVSSRIMKHRKLFLTPTINDSIVCPDFCEPTCPTYCFPYPDTYLLPPPLPQPPLSSNHDQSLSPYVVIIATLLGVTFLIVSYYLVIVKSCGCWNWFRPRRGELGDIDESFADANRGPVIDHPVWYIRTIGLQPSIINSISVVKYKKGDSLTEGADCSICLNEFQDDETLRLLPKCNHSFHISCIDTWLRSHTNCPVCRSGIISNSNSSRQVQETDNQTESAEVDGNRRISDEEIELSQVDIRVQAETSNTRNLTDHSHGNNIVHEDPIQQKRRSISADSLMVAKIKLAIENLSVAENDQKFEPAEYNSSKYTASTSASALLENGSVSLKRSSSYGGRSFFSRHSRSLSLIHPL